MSNGTGACADSKPKMESSATEAGRLASTCALRRFETESRCRRAVTVAEATSHGIRCAPECCVQRGIRLFGLPDPAPAFLVSEPPSRSSTRCRPPWLSQWVHPPVRLTSLQSLSSHRPPGRAEHLPWASIPHRDMNRRSLLTRASQARFVPSSAFLTPPTAFSSTDLAGLFHPAATSRVRSSGSSPREKPYGLVARRCPPVVHTGPLPSVLSIGAREQCPPPGLFSTRESVANSGGLDHRTLGTLLSFCLPRVLLPAPRKRPSSPSPTTAFHGPRRVASARPDLLLRACLPRPRFLA
jgi:hypothetical protein